MPRIGYLSGWNYYPAPIPKGFDMVNPKFATALRISKLIPMVQPQYKREAIRELLSELKKAIG